MDSALAQKLQNYVRLSGGDRLRLAGALGPARAIEAHASVVRDDDDPRAVTVILEGWVCRRKQFEDGRRQILAVLLPGDCCDLPAFLPSPADHAFTAVTPAVVAQIGPHAFRDLLTRSPALAKAFRREMRATMAIGRELAATLGQRASIERLAHLFCELRTRLAAVGLVDGASFPMPLTQVDLGDALAMTSVHTNRMLQQLRRRRLITLCRREITIHDLNDLRRLGTFDSAYLGLGGDA